MLTSRPAPVGRSSGGGPRPGLAALALAAALSLSLPAMPGRTGKALARPLRCAGGSGVVIKWDDPQAQRLVDLLRQRGLLAGTGAGCPAVRAVIERQGERLGVIVLSSAGHYSERQVDDLITAANLIESWARSDITAPLLPQPGEAPGHPAPLSPAVVAPPPVAVAPPAASSRRYSLWTRGELSLGSGGEVWPGAALGGCLRLGPACLGLAFRIGQDAVAVNVGDLTATRLFADLLATLDVPVAAGPVRLSPGVGLGVGYLHTGYFDDDGDVGSVGDGGLRLDAHLSAGLALYRGLSLDLSLALGGAFLGAGNRDAMLNLPQRDNDTAETHPEPALPQPPWGQLRFGLGLRWDQ